MREIHEIKEYQCWIRSTQTSSIVATLALTGESDTFLGGAFFYNDDATSIPPPLKTADGFIGLFYRFRELPTIIDLLRNENPMFLSYDDEPRIGRIATHKEPVGEEEMDQLLESVDD